MQVQSTAVNPTKVRHDQITFESEQKSLGSPQLNCIRQPSSQNISLTKIIDGNQKHLLLQNYKEFILRLTSLPPIQNRIFHHIERQPEIYVDHQHFFAREAFDQIDISVLNHPYFVCYDTEMPSIDSIQSLDKYFAERFPEKSQTEIENMAELGHAFYAMRNFAKKGRLLNGEIPDGKSNHIRDTSNEVLNLRQFAGDVVVSNPLSSQKSEHSVENFYDQIVENIIKHKNGKLNESIQVRVMHPSKDPLVEGYTINFFSQCFSQHLCHQLNMESKNRKIKDTSAPHIDFLSNGHITTLCRTTRAEATPIGRLGQLGYFSTNSFEPDDFVIIADDHAQTGDAWITSMLAAKAGDAKTVGLAAFSIHPFTQYGVFNAKVQSVIIEKLNAIDPDNKIFNKLNSIGISSNTITNFEALILLAIFADPHAESDTTMYQQLKEELSNNVESLKSQFDSLDPELLKTPPTIDLFIEALDQEINTRRKIVEDLPN